MNKPALSTVKKILVSLKKNASKKYISLEMLSSLVGLYSDILADTLEYFAPLVRMDSTLNMKDLIPQLEAYVAEEEQVKQSEPKPARVVATKKEVDQYPNIASFVYEKMTSAGGLVDPSAKLSDHDLRLLQKLVAREVGSRKKASKKKH
jgi:hypothetical protein